MKRINGVLLLGLAFIALAFVGCRSSDNTGEASTRLRRIYDDIDERYESLMAQHRGMDAPAADEEERALYKEMEGMHLRASRERTAMMRGMMGRGGTRRGRMGRGMIEGGMGRGDVASVREWHRQMTSMHQRMAAYHRQHAAPEMAAMHEQMMRAYERALDAEEGLRRSDDAAATTDGEVASGAALYDQECASCHGRDGSGTAGIFPPLAGSDWVTGEKDVPIRIVLHGFEGSMVVAGTSYDGMMPPFRRRLSNEEIARVLTHVRSSWGNNASEIAAADVSAARESERARTAPWSPSQLH
jgi:mono/diheme cytochrome c family protein